MLSQQILNGIGIGCTYALIALGYNLMFGVLKIVNLAYGEIFMVSSFAALLCITFLSANPLIVIIVAIAAAVLVGLLVHFLAVRPLGNVSDVNSPRHLSVIISTLGASLVLQNLAVEISGAYPRRFPRLIPDLMHNIGGVNLDLALFVNLGIATFVMFSLLILLRHTFFGLRIRALAENRDLALCSGIRTTRDELISVVISSGLAGLAAVLISQVIGTVSPQMGLSFGLKGLVVLIVGGLGNMYGAVLVALLLGITEVLTVNYFSSSYRDAVAYALLVTLLIGREMLPKLKIR